MIILTLEPQVQSEVTTFALRSEDVRDATGPPPSVSTRELFEIDRHVRLALPDRPEEEIQAAHGVALFGLAFAGANRNFYDEARLHAVVQKVPLLLRIQFCGDSILRELPWELLHDGERFLAKGTETGLVRWLTSNYPVPTLAVEAPLRVLFTTASPPELRPLDFAGEEAAVRDGLSRFGSRAKLTIIPHVSGDQIRAIWQRSRNRQAPFHLWHHCGHGDLNSEGEFTLALENGKAIDFLSMPQLGELLGTNSGLRAAVFQTCASGSVSGTTGELARIGVPVVVGFRQRLSDVSASCFAGAFYQSLFWRPIEIAVTEGRIALEGREWWDVVVVSRRRDRGLLFTPGSHLAGWTRAEIQREEALRRQRNVIRKFLKGEGKQP